MNPNQNPEINEQPAEKKPLVIQPDITNETVAPATINVARSTQLQSSVYVSPTDPKPSVTPNNSTPSPVEESYTKPPKLLSRLLIVALLSLYASVVLVLSQSLPSTVGYIIALLPIVALGLKKIRGVLLPYALSVGLTITVHVLLSSFKDYYNGQAARAYTPIIDHMSNQTLFISVGLAGLVVSVIAFFLTNYGARRTKLTANILLRIIAALFLLYTPTVAADIPDAANQKATNQQYNQAVFVHNHTTLDANTSAYVLDILAPYSLEGVVPQDKAYNHKSYEVVYGVPGNTAPLIRYTVAPGHIPSTCSNDSTLQLQRTPSGGVFTCGVTITDNNGRPVYAYRSLSDYYGNSDTALQQPASNIKNVPPEYLYIQEGSTLITYNADGMFQYPFSTTANGDTVNGLALRLQLLTGNERTAFINKYIKPKLPVNPKPYEQSVHLLSIPAILLVIYLAVFSWAMENVFEKAGRAYWKVYIPFVNLWVLSKIAGRPGWWSLFAYFDARTAFKLVYGGPFIFLAPIFIPLLLIIEAVRVVLFIIVSTSMAERFGKSKWFGVLLIIPPFPGYILLGFGKTHYTNQESLII